MGVLLKNNSFQTAKGEKGMIHLLGLGGRSPGHLSYSETHSKRIRSSRIGDDWNGRTTFSDDWRVGVPSGSNGQATILGKGRLELLERIDRCRSISAAARDMGMSYRHAWELVQAMNEAAGGTARDGGDWREHGGGAGLTPLGRRSDHRLPRTARPGRVNTASVDTAVADPEPRTRPCTSRPWSSLEDVLGRLLNDYAVQQPECPCACRLWRFRRTGRHLIRLRLPAIFFLPPMCANWIAWKALACFCREAVWLSPEIVSRLLAPTHWRWPFVSPSISLEPPCRGSPSPRRPVLGDYTRAYLDSLRLYEPLLPRAVWVENSRAVVTAVRAGQAEVGLVYSSDAVCADGCRTLFRVRRTPIPIHYAGAVLRRGTDAAAARSLLDFLTSATASRRFRQCGFHPARIGSNSKVVSGPCRTALLSRPPKEQVF